jgi:hypothetical protein
MNFDYPEAVQPTLPTAAETGTQPSGNLPPSPLSAATTLNFLQGRVVDNV